MNKNLFASTRRAALPATQTVNAAGAPAYATSAEHALAQYAATGCLTQTYYASAELQLDTVLSLAAACSPRFVAQVALWSRGKGHMKDLPALLMAYLTVADPALAERVFHRVIDDLKLLRNFVQVVRSGVVARRSLASLPKRLVQAALARRSVDELFRGSVGQDPSLGDVIKLAHPRPDTRERAALYGYLTGRPYDVAALPELVQAYEAWLRQPHEAAPPLPFTLLASQVSGRAAWSQIAQRASWTETRMNLNTFARHGVFESRSMVQMVAAKLWDRAAIERARVLPYQLLTTYKHLDPSVPAAVVQALEAAMEIALENVPCLDGKVYVCPDVSGSMSQPVTGHRPGATTKARCIDVAGLVAAAMLRVCDAEVLPFEHGVVELALSARQSVLENAAKLASVGGGGTCISAPLSKLNASKARGALVVLVSDNESWVGARSGATPLMLEWAEFRRRNPGAKLVCLDVVPNRTTQAVDDDSVLNIGGFSDVVFELIAGFAKGRSRDHWVDTIAKTDLDN
jgi:60 kDa SS-A/Ro ribonucleoprotein